MQSALAQAVMIDPYAKAVMKSSVEKLRLLGDVERVSRTNGSRVWTVLGLTHASGFSVLLA